MARLILVNLDLNGNQILGHRVENLAADPSGGGLYEGRLWINSTTHLLKYYNGSGVVVLGSATGVNSLTVDDSSIENIGTASDPSIRVKALGITDAMLAGSISNTKLATNPLARANHTGTQLAATISDFDTQVRTSTLNQMTAPTADLSINTHKLTNVVDPTSAQDAATKNYVDALVNGVDWKASVRAATTANGTLATAFANGQTIDGVVLATGNRILLKNQTAGAENGIYVVQAAGAPVRATDADASAEVTAGLGVFVSEGTVNGNTSWILTTDDPITLATTALVFTQFAGPGAVTAGTGITVTGTQVALTIPVAITSGGTGQITAAAALAALGGTTKFSADIGDGASLAYVVTHNLNTRDCQVTVYSNTTPWAEVIVDVEHTSVNTITVRFAVAPTTNQYRVTVIG
jgi:hypothetical protein